MLAAFVISLRESAEALLVLSIIYAYLSKTSNTSKFIPVLFASLIAVLISIGIFFALGFFSSLLTDYYLELFEGVTMMFAAFLITTFILWMKGRKEHLELKKKLAPNLIVLSFLSFISTLREGIETSIFLFGLSLKGEEILIPSIFGIVVATVIFYLTSKKLISLDLKLFFNLTGALLIVFSAGLIARGIGELQEVGWLPTFVEEIWNAEGVLSEESFFGSFLKTFVGYDSTPSLLQAVAYFSYLIGVGYFYAFERKSIN